MEDKLRLSLCEQWTVVDSLWQAHAILVCVGRSYWKRASRAAATAAIASQ